MLEKLTPRVFAPSLVTLFSLDMWSHPLHNVREAGRGLARYAVKADLENREWIAQNFPVVGELIATHVGNLGYSAGLMIPFAVAGKIIKDYGAKKENESLEALGKYLPLAGFLGIVAVNLLVELTTPGNNQTLGDVTFGAIGAGLAWATSEGTLARIKTHRAEHAKLRECQDSPNNLPSSAR